ncbi:MAG: GtrA family protein [Proteobacteria bacterium]|nr:GtrA family protein [Pseudomonadota bacterium]
MPDIRDWPAWCVRHGLAAQFVRFVVVGLTNTGIGYAAYLLALRVAGFQTAYAIAYGVGIVSAYLLNSKFVFRRSLALSTAVRYPSVYLVQYVAGALMLQAIVRWFGMDRRWAALLVLALSVPVSFAINRSVLAAGKPQQDK